MRKALLSLGFVLVLIAAAPVMAQESISKLKGIGYGSPETFAEFHGFVDLDYYDFQKGGDNNGNSSLEMSHLYLTTTAKIRSNLMVFGEIEYESGGSQIKVDRAFVDWEISPALQLRLGKFYSPFGLEIREYQSPLLELVSRPLYVEVLEYGEWTDTGINAYGVIGPSAFTFDYDIAVMNGPAGILADVDRQEIDNNNNKTVAGRVGVQLNGLQIGTSYATGKYDTADQLKFNLWSVDARLKWMGVDIRGEYVQRDGDNDPADGPTLAETGTAVPAAEKASGYYVQASYHFQFDHPYLYMIEPIVRYDDIDPDEDIKNNEDQSRVSLGVRYMPYPHYALKAEYDIVQEKHGPSINNNGVLFQAVADF